MIKLEDKTAQTPESEKPYTRENLVDAIDRLKTELEDTGRKPTEMEAYGIKHALTHYDKAFPDEADKTSE